MVYRAADNNALWATHTHVHSGHTHLVVQEDGNLVLYNPSNPNNQHEKPVWASNTNGRDNNARLIMQDDGNLVLYCKNRQPLWASGTDGGRDLI